MNSKKLAELLAVAVGPHVWIPVIFILLVFKSEPTSLQLKTILPSALTLQVIAPVAYLLTAPKLGWTGQWGMKKEAKEHRYSY